MGTELGIGDWGIKELWPALAQDIMIYLPGPDKHWKLHRKT